MMPTIESKWFHPLKNFPAGLLDQNGYILFENRSVYEKALGRYIKQDINIPNGISSLSGYIVRNDTVPTADPLELDQKAYKIKALYESGNLTKEPEGQKQPDIVISQAISYKRDPSVKAFVLQEAKGVCECCGKPAPFIGENEEPYLEVHHLIRLADKGTDTVDNAIAVCPNCHRELHFGKLKNSQLEKIIAKNYRLKKP